MEPIAIATAAENLTPEADKTLTALVNKMASGGVGEFDVKVFHDCDVAFHRAIGKLAGNKSLEEALEAITFCLFVFSVVGRWPDNPRAVGERLVAAQQHLEILEGQRSRNGQTARAAFIRQTVRYWNAEYGLEMNEEELKPSPAEPAKGSGSESRYSDRSGGCGCVQTPEHIRVKADEAPGKLDERTRAFGMAKSAGQFRNLFHL